MLPGKAWEMLDGGRFHLANEQNRSVICTAHKRPNVLPRDASREPKMRLNVEEEDFA